MAEPKLAALSDTKMAIYFRDAIERERAREMPLYKGDPDLAQLIKLQPLDQVAELMAEGYNTAEIAEVLGYANRHSANGAVQRIRGQLGWQAS